MNPNDVIKKIIDEQSLIIGQKLAQSRAVSTKQIRVAENTSIEVEGDPKEAVDKLIEAYSEIFGKSSEEVCIDVIRSFPYNDVEAFLPDRIKSQVSHAVK